jgi:hypothetical protein
LIPDIPTIAKRQTGEKISKPLLGLIINPKKLFIASKLKLNIETTELYPPNKLLKK